METIALQHHPVLLELQGYEGVPEDVLQAITEAERYARRLGKGFGVRAPNKAFRDAVLENFQESNRQRNRENGEESSAKAPKILRDDEGHLIGSNVENSQASRASLGAIKSMLNHRDQQPDSKPEFQAVPKSKKKKAKKKRTASDYAKLAGIVLLGTSVLGFIEYRIIFGSEDTPVSLPKKIMESNALSPNELQGQIDQLKTELEQTKRELSNALRERDVLKEALRITKAPS